MDKATEFAMLSLLKEPQTFQKGFNLLVYTFKEKLYWHIRYMVKNHDDAHDILQNTFIKVFKNIGSFKAESKIYTWLYRIATNEALTFLTKKAKQKTMSYEEFQQNLTVNLEADAFFDGDQGELLLQKAIATLPQKQQQVFIMKYFDALKYKEIAEILETSEGALKASYHLAVKKIEEFIKAN